MPLAAGTRLGPYEIVAPLGAGGMGEVYKARDTRLDRTIAVKVLPEHVASNPELKQRFEREAKTLAALSDPHICPVFDVGREGGVDFLVMEYLEGETLAERLRKGALPVEPALDIAGQIAGALDAAHRRGITHRDLKPGNVMLVRGAGTSAPPTVKLLDFGLAKMRMRALTDAETTMGAGDEAPRGPGDAPLTARGTLLGTYPYMAPEQIEGEEADARTDLFAFGCVLFEMLTGRRAFEGKSAVSLLGAILKDDPPPVSRLQPVSPPVLDRVIRTCLAKDPNKRVQSAHDVRLQLEWLRDGVGTMVAPTAGDQSRMSARRAWIAAGVATVVALGAIGFTVWSNVQPKPASDGVVFTIAPPDGFRFNGFSLSPDGRTLAFVTRPGGLWVRPLDAPVARPLPDTDGAVEPFWSPDSRFLAFSQRTALKKIDAAGGPAVALGATTNLVGAWSPHGDILIPPMGAVGALLKLSETGGPGTPLTTLDQTRDEFLHFAPSFLPDGRSFLFLAMSRVPLRTTVYVASLSAASRTALLEAGQIAYSAGHLLYLQAGTLKAQAFDERSGRFAGDVVPIASPVATFTASANGTIAYRPPTSARPTVLTWLDRSGRTIGTVGDPGGHQQLRLAPDGKYVAIQVNQAAGLRVLDLATGVLSPLTSSNGLDPVWAPDSQSVVFRGEGGKPGFFRRPLGGRTDTLITAAEAGALVDDVSVDGRFLLYHVEEAPRFRLLALPLTGQARPIPVADAPQLDGSHMSPDNRWVAYESSESGAFEMYVVSFPGLEYRRQVSAHGGTQARWRRDGRELFFVGPDQTLMSVSVGSGEKTSAFGPPRPLFKLPETAALHTWGFDDYDVTAEGTRFLFPLFTGPAPDPPLITVMTHWIAGLKGK